MQGFVEIKEVRKAHIAGATAVAPVMFEPAMLARSGAKGYIWNMEKADRRSKYMLGAFLIIAYTMPFGIGIYTDNVFFTRQWLLDLTAVVLHGFMQD